MTSSGSVQSVVALIMRAPSPVAGDRGSARRHQLPMTRVRTGSAPSYCEPLPARTAAAVGLSQERLQPIGPLSHGNRRSARSKDACRATRAPRDRRAPHGFCFARLAGRAAIDVSLDLVQLATAV